MNSYSRREFIKINSVNGLYAALSAGVLTSFKTNATAKGSISRSSVHENEITNIKLCHRIKPRISDDEMLFLKQIGVKWVRAEFYSHRNEGSYEQIRALQARLAKYDIKIYSATHTACRTKAVHLGEPGRDSDIETYQNFIRDLSRLGIGVAAYSFHSATTSGTGRAQHRGYDAKEFDLAKFRKEMEEQRYEREYAAEEIWASYTYLMNAILPVAEEFNVKLALHADDPPLPMMNGVARIFADYEGHRRAEQIANSSEHWGLCFCVGTWAEGGNNMGKSIIEMIDDFGKRGKMFEIHFRNVSSPLPYFFETFPDDGYVDMYEVMKAFRKAGVNGALMLDHLPKLIGDEGILRGATAYGIAYTSELLRRANKELATLKR